LGKNEALFEVGPKLDGPDLVHTRHIQATATGRCREEVEGKRCSPRRPDQEADVLGVLGVRADMVEDVDDGHGCDLGRKKKKSRQFRQSRALACSDAKRRRRGGKGALAHQEVEGSVHGAGR
jgi:hypothetical protein